MVTLYILMGVKGKRYVGITNDLGRRFREHQSRSTKAGQVIGAFEVLLTETYVNHASARQRERFLKSGQGREWLNAFEREAGPASGG